MAATGQNRRIAGFRNPLGTAGAPPYPLLLDLGAGDPSDFLEPYVTAPPSRSDRAGYPDALYVSRDRVDGLDRLASPAPGKAGLHVTRYLMTRPDFGLTSPSPYADSQIAVVHLAACGQRDVWCDGRHIPKPPVLPGGLGIYDRRRAWVADVRGPFHTVNFEIPRWKLDELAEELRGPRIDTLVCPADAPGDEALRHLALALLPALTKPWEASSLFVEHVLAAASTHLARKYGGLQATPARAQGGLTPWQERCAKDMMLANLETDVRLTDLAGACGLSTSYFSRAFKQATGLPPYRWLLEQRVAAAKRMIESTRAGLSDIALACGFADQCHFTRVFSKLAGCSPGAWRRLRQG